MNDRLNSTIPNKQNDDLPSCDTFALKKCMTESGENLLAKNSDRPLGEAQGLVFFEAEDHLEGEMLRCTHLEIPEVPHTYAVLGSRPYWIWGFEMGVNEYGVCIGNEAEGSRSESETEDGLLGMDMLRLALERSRTAKEAAETITKLLEVYGQNANASMLFDRRYENSFLIMDREEILKLETAGRQWALQSVSEWTAISNCYTILTDYDSCSERAETYARMRRWLSRTEPFNFAKAYTMPADRQKNAIPRLRRMEKLIRESSGQVCLQGVKRILRDHFEGEINAPRFGAFAGTFYTICMHAESYSDAETAASWICTYDRELGTIVRYAAALPCTSAYIPIFFGSNVPAALSYVPAQYDPASLWWRMEYLSVLTGVDEDRFAPEVRNKLASFEEKLEKETELAIQNASALIRNGKRTEACLKLSELTERAVAELIMLSAELTDWIRRDLLSEGGIYGPRKELTDEYIRKVSFPTVGSAGPL